MSEEDWGADMGQPRPHHLRLRIPTAARKGEARCSSARRRSGTPASEAGAARFPQRRERSDVYLRAGGRSWE